MTDSRRMLAAAVLVLSFAGSACRRSAADHVRSGESYYSQGRYNEAIVEFRAALQANPRLGKVRLELGDAYVRVSDGRSALREYLRGADLLADDANAQVKAGNALLLAQSFDDARSRAERALAIDPDNVDATVLKGNALAGLRNFDQAVEQYERVIAADPNRGTAYGNLGAVQFLQGKTAEAEATFKTAIAKNPDSVAAHLALANFYWAAGRRSESEQTVKEALKAHPDDIAANRTLGTLYMATGRVAAAEPHFKIVADKSNSPAYSLALASYYYMNNRRADARRVLTGVAARPEAYADATVRLAALDVADGKRGDGDEKLRAVLSRYPKDESALLLKATLLLGDRKRDEALAAANAAIANDPNSARAHQLAGQIYAAGERFEDAIKEYQMVLKLDSRPIGATLELARLYLQQGAPDRAATYAQQALTLEPDNAVARGLLIRSYVRQQDVGKARPLIASLEKSKPNASFTYDLMALAQIADGKPAAARGSYERALRIDPTDLEAIAGLVRLDLDAHRTADATGRVGKAIERGTPGADLLILGARTFWTAGDLPRAEALLRQAIAADPSRLQSYGLLGQLYAKQNRMDEAIASFRDVLKQNPKSVSAITMIGILLEGQGKHDEAVKEYERALAVDPRAAVAANNLAWRYLASGQSLDKALELARTAQQVLPEEPQVGDTLGWIYVRRNMASAGLPYLQASADKSPADATIQYHLGMAYIQAGETEKGRKVLSRALTMKPDFDGAVEARQALERTAPSR